MSKTQGKFDFSVHHPFKLILNLATFTYTYTCPITFIFLFICCFESTFFFNINEHISIIFDNIIGAMLKVNFINLGNCIHAWIFYTASQLAHYLCFFPFAEGNDQSAGQVFRSDTL